ncbi:MAG: alpha/beta fold hydrolase [Candidatus Limnocylindrales bacterium]
MRPRPACEWRKAAVEQLARLGRVITYDRRGCTRSERPEPYQTSVEEQVEDAASLVSALDAAPAIVIGRSYGGGIALGLAMRHPELVRALVLLEPADMVIDGVAEPWEQDLQRIVEQAAASDPDRVAEALLRSVLDDEQWAAWPDEFKAMVAANSPAVLAEVRGAPLQVTSAMLAATDVPTLLVAGETSPPAFRANNDRLAAVIPDARTVLVGGGHLIDPGDPGALEFVGEVLRSERG